METKKLKVMRGSEKHPELVREWLDSQGATDSSEWGCNDDDCYYFVADGLVLYEKASCWVWKFVDHEVIELEEPKPQHVFQLFDKVLVRDSESSKWDIDIFRRYDPDTELYMCFRNSWWYQCIPYEGNEHLFGTTDAPKGGEK